MTGPYWFLLTRQLSGEGPSGVFVMLNPSTADEKTDDPTIRKCVGFAPRWGWSELRVVNLFALRATDPRTLHRAVATGGLNNAYGSDNEDMLSTQTASGPVVVGWGSHGARYRSHIARVTEELLSSALLCLGVTKSGIHGTRGWSRMGRR